VILKPAGAALRLSIQDDLIMAIHVALNHRTHYRYDR